jgi:hypothetical protein
MIGRSARGRTLANNPQLLAEFGYRFQERAGIIEYHAGLSREDAETAPQRCVAWVTSAQTGSP